MQKQSWVNLYLAYIASILMIMGVNLPLYMTKVNGDKIIAVSRLDNEGILLLISAIVVIMFRFAKRKKYIIVPIVFQLGIMVYYFYIFMSDSKFNSIHIGFVLEAAAIIFLIISMFVDIEVKEEKIHDMSTMRIINVEEEYKDSVVLKDLSWIVLSIVVTSIVIVLKIRINENSKGVITSSVPESTTHANEVIGMDETLEFECDRYALGISNVYISSESNKEIVYLEIKVKNKLEKAVVFHQLFDVRVMQDKLSLDKCNYLNTNAYDINNTYIQLNPGVVSTAYVAFTLKQSDSNVRIFMDEINGKNKNQVLTREFDMNEMYYVDTIEEVIEVNKKINNKEKQVDKEKDINKKDNISGIKDKKDDKTNENVTNKDTNTKNNLDKSQDNSKDSTDNKEQTTNEKQEDKNVSDKDSQKIDNEDSNLKNEG